MNYLLFVTTVEKGSAKLETLENVPREHRMKIGEPSLDWPDDAAFEMSADYPKDVRLLDCLDNVSSMIVVSERFKAALEAFPGALAGNEVLPIKIVNHKKRTEKAPYFLIHQVGHVPCLDEAATVGKRSTLDPKVFQFMKTMVVNEKTIPKDRLLLRPAQYDRLPLIRRDLAEALEKKAFTGVKFVEVDKHAW